MQINDLTREQWLLQAANILTDTIMCPAMDALGEQYDLEQYRVSIGHPQSKKSIGECWKKSASTDQHNEIFITPHEDNSTAILATLIHELIHAADDCESGHKNFFARVARKVGLVGKLTATKAGDNLQEQLLDIVDAIGDIPHHKLDITHRVKPKQSTRMLKIECTGCGFNFRASKTQIKRMTIATCNSCGHEHGYAVSMIEALEIGQE